MTDRNDRGSDRTETARRTDDSDLIETMAPAPDFGSASGGNLQRDIGTRDEQKRRVDGSHSVTRVRGSDKRED